MYGNCPECNVSWDNGDIPLSIRKHYSAPYKWSKIIRVNTLGEGVNYYMCPGCYERFELEEIKYD